ncbi:hypothetical protein [Pseudarthrobacter niigatensis]|uniref:Uncharacterized protein n=1 Tax=Pseudarthrobacter niigatensis TaxID=369935 RepID=A0AAJ1WEH0_9MICC|nr:hypothetical protein [Pseudarthrobacter niigatensis]MDQ0147314.1 hypothetical protein [Pseudarthrobacter niigatensis]MDQ0267131.1 hypothetical protein [Pseudarthrobacter niigatensis]
MELKQRRNAAGSAASALKLLGCRGEAPMHPGGLLDPLALSLTTLKSEIH